MATHGRQMDCWFVELDRLDSGARSSAGTVHVQISVSFTLDIEHISLTNYYKRIGLIQYFTPK